MTWSTHEPDLPDAPREPAPAPASDAAPFTIADGFVLVLWNVVAQILVIGPLLAARGGEVDLDAGFVAGVLASQLVALGGGLAYLQVRGRLDRRLVGRRRIDVRTIGLGVVVGGGGYLIVALVVAAVAALTGDMEPPDQALLRTTTAGGLATVLSVVSAVAMAPLVEEVIFRGVLFRAVRDRVGVWSGIGVSAVVWTLMHSELDTPPHIVGLALLGAWFAWWLDRSRTLVVPLVAHATFNGISVVLALTVAGT